MATYTEEDIAKVRAAYASGEQEIQFQGKKVVMRSAADLERIIATMQADMAAAAGGVRGGPRRFTFTTARGE